MEGDSTVAPASDRLFTRALSAEYRRDPYPFLAELRASRPLYRSSLGPWVVSRYEDAARLLRDPRVGNRPPEAAAAAVHGAAQLARAGVPLPINALDPPEHGRVRALATQAFTLVAEPALGRVQLVVDRLLDDIGHGDGATVDLVEELAYPLPMALMCDMLGVPRADGDLIRRWGTALAEDGDPDGLLSPDTRAAATAAQRDFAAYFADLVVRRRRGPGDDLVSALIAARQGRDRLSFAELVVNGMFFVVNGYHNTVSLIANAVLALLRHEDQLARLRGDGSLAAGAVEECLRYDSPVHSIARSTTEDRQIAGVAVPAGSQLMLLVGAAHRDPAAFPDPDRLDIDRAAPARPLSFGGGAHYCPGARLARAEAQVALRSLARRFPRLALAGEPSRAPTFALRGLTALPVRVR